MKTKKRYLWTRSVVLAIAGFFSALVPMGANALAFSDLVIFGDSLSDTGNLSFVSGGLKPGQSEPYFQGRYSDGLIWTDYLAQGLGLTNAARPYQLGGNNYAYAGARTGGVSLVDGVPGVLAQTYGLWGSTHVADPGALYVLVAGGNDLRDSRSNPFGTGASRQIDAEAAAENLARSLNLLASKGAKHVLLSTLPDLGDTFEAAALFNRTESADVTNRFNSLIPYLAAYGTGLGLDVDVLDMYGVAKTVRADPQPFGVSNIALPCEGFAGAGLLGPATSCAESLFSDGLHPSSRSHQLIAAAAFETLGVTPVPEPETYAMLLAGLAMIGAVARRRSQKQAA